MEMVANKSAHMYCGQGVDDFHTAYSSVHGYIAILVCIFGIIANILNIIVLTRHEMRSPTNAILTGLAIADLLVMIDYIPYACMYIMQDFNFSMEDRLTYRWTFFVFFHSIFAQICHTIAIWLTVTLAIWRYIAIGLPQKNHIWCNMQATLYAIFSSYVICPLVVIPIYFSYSIIPKVQLMDSTGNPLKIVNDSLSSDLRDEGHNVTLYRLGTTANETLLTANIWIYSVLIKLIPCVALTILSYRLISALLEAKRRRKNLISDSACMKQLTAEANKKDGRPQRNSRTLEKERQTDRTTKMLLAVLLLFLLTEFPQGILGLLSAILGSAFFIECYMKFGELMDILALINSAINFILYCSMSRQFRTTFCLLFRPKFLYRWLPPSRDPAENETNNGRPDTCKGNNGNTTQVTQL